MKALILHLVLKIVELMTTSEYTYLTAAFATDQRAHKCKANIFHCLQNKGHTDYNIYGVTLTF